MAKAPTAKQILDLELGPNDADAKTIRDYLRALLLLLWDEEECFSGKHPFGNSSWQFDLYPPLIKAGFLKGKLDGDGFAIDFVREDADELIVQAICGLE